MIVFPGDFVLHRDSIHQVVDTDGYMMIKLANGKWIEASKRDIDGIRSESEVIDFLSMEEA